MSSLGQAAHARVSRLLSVSALICSKAYPPDPTTFLVVIPCLSSLGVVVGS